jgi:hypothetical protein
MTITARTASARSTAGKRPPMTSERRTALLVGVLFLITYATSITAKVVLYPPLLTQDDYIVTAGSDTRALWGAFLEVLLVMANIGTAVAFFRILRRQNENLALAFVAARIMESVLIAVGILSVLSVVTVRQDLTGSTDADATALTTVGQALVALHDWTFNLGPGFTVGIGNGLILGYLLYRSGLVPRGMAMLGLIGGPLICLSGVAVMFDLIQPDSAPLLMASVPEFLWELSLGIYLVTKGFKPSPILTDAVDGR